MNDSIESSNVDNESGMNQHIPLDDMLELYLYSDEVNCLPHYLRYQAE